MRGLERTMLKGQKHFLSALLKLLTRMNVVTKKAFRLTREVCDDPEAPLVELRAGAALLCEGQLVIVWLG